MTDYYVRACSFCGDTIELRKITDSKYLPFNENGSRHFCKKRDEK